MPNRILGKLRGLIASAADASRNGRRYTEHFWDSIFSSPLFKEGIKNKVYFGELWHPDDDKEYQQIHPSDDRSAIVLTKVTKKGLDYIGDFEILPTTAGKTLRSLIDIGCRFGVSSRGTADINREVFDDPSTYELVTFDIVAFPGMERARLDLVSAVNENLKINKSKEKIMENLNSIKNNDKTGRIKSYINKTLKTKEDFDYNLQVEDVFNDLDVDDDLRHYANIVTTDNNGVPTFDDGKHGKLEVVSYNNLNLSPNSSYIIDAVVYKDNIDKYVAYGDWLKLK